MCLIWEQILLLYRFILRLVKIENNENGTVLQVHKKSMEDIFETGSSY